MGKGNPMLDQQRGGCGSGVLSWFPSFPGQLEEGTGAVTVPSSLHELMLFVSVLSDAGRAVNNERGLGNPSLQGEGASGTVREFLFYSLAFLSKLPVRRSKNKKLGQVA